ncbi:DUF5615 family PIN-like protein [Kamptonema animale CS-326]|jgi:predicted nuclease of predicted toxin-antitoxin system|uniref:DUF5615 family PIN-like protein n=1 Tax=Kamptonema animale TaxID=92934 RepID=UPI00232F2575|nr:DUF5615 family PIN-like protein [Kamptonema animale]MDB9511819.1 DUF5615 family PIN-like protein [Kamptonema animale CS-326]
MHSCQAFSPVSTIGWLRDSSYPRATAKNAKLDVEIKAISLKENRVVVTKDRDFWDSFLIRKEPYKLLILTTGNIINVELEVLFLNNLPQLAELFQQHSLIEMSRDAIVVRE